MSPPGPQDAAARELLLFRQRLFSATPRLWVTQALIAVNIGVWLLQVVMGVNASSPGAEVLVDWGGNLGSAVHAGEYWRLLTATALHGGAIHLSFNMFALWIIGQTVERVLGNAGFAATYLISGLAGSVASVIASPDVVSVGASGAVFGILGAQLTALLSRRVGLPASLRPSILRNGVFIIGINLALGFTIPNIDNAAHMGGLIAGAVTGAGLAHSLTPVGVVGRGRRAAIAVVLGLGLLSATLMLVPSTKTSPATVYKRVKMELARINSEAMSIDRQYAKGDLSAAEAADKMERDVLPMVRRVGKQVDQLETEPDVRKRAREATMAQLDLYSSFANHLRKPSRQSKLRLEEAQERARTAAEHLR